MTIRSTADGSLVVRFTPPTGTEVAAGHVTRVGNLIPNAGDKFKSAPIFINGQRYDCTDIEVLRPKVIIWKFNSMADLIRQNTRNATVVNGALNMTDLYHQQKEEWVSYYHVPSRKWLNYAMAKKAVRQ